MNFTINKKYDCLDFSNGYWLPLDMFEFYVEENLNEGFNHLSHKNWVSDSLLRSIADKLKQHKFKDYSKDVEYVIILRNNRVKFLEELTAKFRSNG